MISMFAPSRASGLAALSLLAAACGPMPAPVAAPNPVVGAWLVKDAAAPFPYHMYVFNADGTMQQANPDAGDPNRSDSDGKGVWRADGKRIRGRWMEVRADRVTHRYSGRTEISFDLEVSGDRYTGTETVVSYDDAESLSFGPTAPSAIEGRRVTVP